MFYVHNWNIYTVAFTFTTDFDPTNQHEHMTPHGLAWLHPTETEAKQELADRIRDRSVVLRTEAFLLLEQAKRYGLLPSG
jgi:hypothetical protein